MTTAAIARPGTVNLRFGLPFLLLGASSVGQTQIAYVKHNSVFVLPCDSAGRVNGRAFRVCRLWRHYNGDGVEIGWASDGRIVLVHHVDAWNGPKRFGLPQHGPVNGISIVEAKPGAPIQWVAAGEFPAFTPDGRRMFFSTGDGDGDLWHLDLKTHSKRIFQRHSVEPVLSCDGVQLAYIRVDPGRDFESHVEVRALPTGKGVAAFDPVNNPCELQFAPSGSVLAIHYHLSRPLTGHGLYPLGKDRVLELQTPDQFAPAVIDDWSPDGLRMLCSWRIVDPNNDGNWIREYVGLTPLGPGKPRRIAIGTNSMFAADGRHILYTTDGRTGVRAPQDLMWQSLDGKPAKLIAKNVAAFVVYRRFGTKRVTISYR